MKYHLKKIIPSIILSATLLINCDDKWDEHYNQGTYEAPEYNMSEYIAQNPELSIFNQMLKKTGYDKALASSQFYTVWAPVNEALAEIDTTDFEKVKDIVRNHITRGQISSVTYNLSVKMLNGKSVGYTFNGSDYKFGNNNVIDANIPASNGLVNTINGYAPPLPNLWEFLGKYENLDSIKAFIYGQTEKEFDRLNSVVIGTDSGITTYDSVFKLSNAVLENIGAIDNEDSIYTALLPDTAAWKEAYERIESYFIFPNDAGGRERQSNFTKFMIINDMLYRGRINEPGNLTSITSTRGNTFSNPAEIFNNAYQTNDLSNGIAFITDHMPVNDTLWFKEIRIEAEEVEGRSKFNCLIWPKNSYGSGFDISGNKYILVDPTAPEPFVEFSIPNTLSATYNIYCVFVPATIVDRNDTIPTKVRYELTQINRQSGSVVTRDVDQDSFAYTSPTGLTKMFVDQVKFKFANVIEEDYSNVVVKLKVINDVTSGENYSSTMRIDCVILEPVFE